MKKIPFHKTYITDDEINQVVDTMKSGWLTMGPKTIRFEEDYASFIGAKYAISTNSCTSALHLALKAIDLKPGDEVVVPVMTFTATAAVVCHCGAKPVPIDVEKDTHNIDITKIEEKITSKTRAIIPVHFAGQPCDMDELIQLAKLKNLKIIEDAAHAIPSFYRNNKIGTLGDLTCFSFYATKTLATGEGGMVCTDLEELAQKVKMYRLHGITTDAWKRYTTKGSWYYEVLEPGYKYNMSDIQSAIGLVQLKKVEWMLDQRRRIAQQYTKAFSKMDQIITPTIKSDRESSWHLYVIKLDLDKFTITRDQFIEKLSEKGVGTSVHFIPLFLHPFYRDVLKYDYRQFPSADWLFKRIVSLPIYPDMDDRDVESVINAVNDICNKYKR